MAYVGIRGVGLSCALGMDAESCVATLLGSPKPPSRVTLDGLAEDVTVSYYRIPDSAELFDPQRFARLLPSVVRSAVAQAELSAVEVRGLPVFIGSSCFSIGQSETAYAAALAQSEPRAYPMPHCGYGWLADLVEEALGSVGETFTYNTACTSSANALLGASRALVAGRYRHALVVGAELANRTTLCGFSGLQLLAERSQPFAAERAGIVLGEGIGAVLLSTEAGAGASRLHDGVSNCDTFSVTTANPDGESVQAALSGAMQRAGIAVDQVRGIKAHGTGSPSGDVAEAVGLRRTFMRMPPLVALKPYIGHTLGACGVNELVLYAGAMARGRLPALSDFGAPDPELDVRPLAETAPALAGYYLLNHFGFGGNNTVLVLEKPA